MLKTFKLLIVLNKLYPNRLGNPDFVLLDGYIDKWAKGRYI